MKSNFRPTEIGKFPEDWEIRPFSEFLDFRNGINAPKGSYGSGVRFANVLEVITHTHLRAGHIPGRVNICGALVNSFRVRRGDLVFNRTSETQEEVGLSAVYIDDELIVFGGFVIRGRPKSGVLDPVFAGYALRSPAVRAQIIARGQGAIRANIGQGDLKQVLTPVPPIPEQRAIARSLTDADELIDSLALLIAKKRDLKQAAMQQLLTARTRLRGFSEDWRKEPLEALFDFSGGLSASREQLSDAGTCYLHYGDIHKTNRSWIDVKAEFLSIPKLNIPLGKVSRSALLEDGDVVFVDASEDDEGASKHVVVVNPDGIPYISGLHTIVAKSIGDGLDNVFKRYCFQTKEIKDQFRYYAVGTKVSGISKSNIRKIFLRFPRARVEQAAIAGVLQDMDAEIEALEVRLEKTRALKQGMMQELLTGRTRLA